MGVSVILIRTGPGAFNGSLGWMRRWTLRISAGAAGLLLFLLAALAVANTFFFDSLAGWASLRWKSGPESA